MDSERLNTIFRHLPVQVVLTRVKCKSATAAFGNNCSGKRHSLISARPG